MPGLLESLQNVLSGSDISAAVDGQAGLLQQVIEGAAALSGGPSALTEIEALLSGDGVPRLDAGPLALLGGGISSLPLSGDVQGPLAPLLSPLTGLIGLQAGFGSALSTLNVLRQAIELVFRRAVQGGNALPLGLAAFGRHGLPTVDLDLDEARQSVQDAVALLAEIPALEPTRLVELAKRLGRSFDLAKWPRIPGVTEAAEALQTVARWESASGGQIASDLARHTALAAQVAMLPRTRVVTPLVQASERALSLATLLQDPKLYSALDRLRASARPGARAPGKGDLDTLEQRVQLLEAAASALDLERGPFSKLSAVPADLELALERSIRAFTPSSDVSRLVRGPLATFASVPLPEAAVFTDVVASIEAIDISALTDPLTRVRDAVQEAVQAIEDAKLQVRDELTDLLAPVDQALSQLVAAAGLDTLPARLEELRQQLETLVQEQIIGRLAPIQGAVSELVSDLQSAVEGFDPEQLLAPIRAALDELAAILSGDEVMGAIATVEAALQDAVSAIEAFSLAPAADVVIDNFAQLEAKISAIDPATIPDAAKPLLRQAVDGVVNIDISAEVAAPITDGLRHAIEAGPGALVSAIRGATDTLRAGIEDFKPSEIVGDALQEPFDELLATLQDFKPSALLERLQAALRQLVAAVSVDGLTQLLVPLEEAHAAAADAIVSLRPSNLLRPVEQAIEDAVAEVLRTTGADAVLDGLTSAFDEINAWVDVALDARAALENIARVLESPGDGEAALQALVDAAMARLQTAEVSAMQPALLAARASAAAIRGDVLLSELAVSVRAAVDGVPAVLQSAHATRLRDVVRAFPLRALRALPPQPRRTRLARLVERLLAVCTGLESAVEPWRGAGRLRDVVAELPARMQNYQRLFRYEGQDIFASFAQPVSSAADLVPLVRPVLERDLRPALQLVFAMLRALGPHVAVIARGLGEALVAVRAKLSAITGDAGLAGIVSGVDEIADMLRDIDLTALTDPLDAIYARIEGAWDAVSPERLRPVLTGFAQAVEQVLDLGNLIDQNASAQLDSTWETLLADLRALSPRQVVASTLDPAFARALQPVDRLLALPEQLQTLVDTAAEHVPDDALEQLARVEVAFDALLRALPLGDSSASASVSVSGSLAVGG